MLQELLLLVACAGGSAFACVRTSPTTSVTTTTTTAASATTTTAASATTTTTAATTTTTTANLCTTCEANQINFVQATADPITIDATYEIGPADANGCSTLTAICNGDPGMVSFMEFNVDQGGPAENAAMTQIVEAPLTCMDGEWYYRNERVITQVECTQSPM